MSLGTSRKSSRPQENTDRVSWRVRPPTPLRSLRHARCAVRQRLEGDSEGWLGCTRRCRFSYFRGLTAAGGGQWPSAAGVTSGASTWLATFAAVAASAAAIAAACPSNARGGRTRVVDKAPLHAAQGTGPKGASTVTPQDATTVFISGAFRVRPWCST